MARALACSRRGDATHWMSRKRKSYPKPKTAMTTVAAPADLKRLAFVESAAVNTASYVTGSTAFAKACGYYTSAKETDALKVCPYPSDWHETSARFSRGLALRVAILLPDASRARISPLRMRAPPSPPSVSNRPKTRSTLPSHAFAFYSSPLNRTAGLPDQDRGPHQGLRRARRVQGPGEVPHLHDHRRRQGMPTSTSEPSRARFSREIRVVSPLAIFFLTGGANATRPRPRDTPRSPRSPRPQVDLAVTALQGIWADKIASSVPVAYAKAAVALTPEKVEELKAMREAYYAKIEATLESLKSRAVKLPAEVTAAVTAAIAEARARIEDAHLFEKVKAAYETVLAYPAVVAVLEKTAPVASKAADVAAPYVAKARTIAEPYVVKGMEVAGPYVNAIKEKVMPPKPAPAQQLD